MALIKAEKLAVYLTLVSLAWGAYLMLVMAQPVVSNPYNLSELQLNLLRASFAVPFLLVWEAAVYGAMTFRSYANSIGNSSDGRALKVVSRGLLVLAAGLVASSLINAARTYLIQTNLKEEATIFLNYFQAFTPLLGMYWIFKGSKDLSQQSQKDASAISYRLIYIILGIIGAVYIFFVLNNPNRTVATTPGVANPTYFLPDWLIISTIVIPYLLTWLFGGLAAKHILAYQGAVKGSIYRDAFRRLAYGIITVILLSIGLQFLVSVSAALVGAGLGLLLLLIYIIIAVYAAGYVLIAAGASKLNRIEEVV